MPRAVRQRFAHGAASVAHSCQCRSAWDAEAGCRELVRARTGSNERKLSDDFVCATVWACCGCRAGIEKSAQNRRGSLGRDDTRQCETPHLAVGIRRLVHQLHQWQRLPLFATARDGGTGGTEGAIGRMRRTKPCAALFTNLHHPRCTALGQGVHDGRHGRHQRVYQRKQQDEARKAPR